MSCSKTDRALVVFRAAALSIVVWFAFGPSAALFCMAWCEPQVAAENGCYHETVDRSATVTSDFSCRDSLQAAAILVREDDTRASRDAGAFVATARFSLAVSHSDSGSLSNREPALSAHRRPLTRPLRI